MDRKLKFRVWDRKLQEMVAPYAVIFDGCGYGHRWYEDNRSLWEWDIPWEKKFEVMECTGLTDANGVDIYENDIVSTHDGLFHVEYLTKEMRYLLVQNGSKYPYYQGKYELVVVGNVFENPELLVEGQLG